MKLPEGIVNNRKQILWGALVVVIIILATSSIYFFQKYKQTQRLIQNPAEVRAEEIKKLLAIVSKLIELPKDELPSVATVTDRKKLINQQIFKNVKDGDQVLIFSTSKKIIIYRPSENRIIDTARMVQDSQNVQSSPTEVQRRISVTIYNGSSVAGLAKKTADKLSSKFNNIEVVDTTNAESTEYKKILVVDLKKGSNKDMVAKISAFLGGVVGELPKGESAPNSDILIVATETAHQ